MKVKKIRIFAIILLVISYICSFVAIVNAVKNYDVSIKLTAFYTQSLYILWFIVYVLIVSMLLKGRNLKKILTWSIFWSVLHMIHLLFLFSAFYYIQLLHYFNWSMNISYMELVGNIFLNDCLNYEFNYLKVFVRLYIVLVFISTIKTAKINKVDEEIEFLCYQIAKPIDKKEEKIHSLGKINSKLRSKARKSQKRRNSIK